MIPALRRIRPSCRTVIHAFFRTDGARVVRLGGVALSALLVGVVATGVIGAGSASAATASTSALRWGIVGNDGTHLSAERAAGVTAKFIDLSWASYMPKPGHVDGSYVSARRNEIAAARAAGFAIVLGLGVQSAPAWVHANYVNSYYVDQYGERYDGGTSPGSGDVNFVWNSQMRTLQQQYVARVFSDLGTSFAAVRLGGGRYGELGYPLASTSSHANTYWAFDANAAASDPVPAWMPGMASPAGQAATFLNWYLAKLADYETWQISTLRRYYAGPAMMLFPSWGIRPGQAAAAIAGNLSGTTSAEINGEVQRGYDYARLVGAITDPNVIVTTDWLDSPYGNDASTNPVDWTPVHYLASLASPRGLAMYGQNTGQGSASVMSFAVAQAARYGLVGMAWYNESQLFSGTWATLANYASFIAAGRAAAPASPAASTPSPTTAPSPTPAPTATPAPAPTATATPGPTPTPTAPAATATATPAPTAGSSTQLDLPAPLRYGLIGNDGTHLAVERGAGIGTKLFELNWAVYEPAQGTYSSNYLTWVRGQIASLRSAGFSIVLSLGMQFAPSWLLSAYPDAYYVDQYGDRYADTCSGCEIPNFVWNKALRTELAHYVARVFADLGTDFAAVRIGGGHYGELGYPTASYNGHANTYWAFDANAAASDPVPGWKPGMSSANGEAGKFLNWYLAQLADYETWQISTVRASYPGPLMLLIPSFGIRPDQAQAAINTNLNGTTSPEINGEIQRGYDYARFVSVINDPNVVIDTTWLDCPYGTDSSTNPDAWNPVHYLAYLAAQNPLHPRLYGENTGQGSAAVMSFTAAQARTYGLAGFLWFDEQELFSGSYATLGDYANLIAANP